MADVIRLVCPECDAVHRVKSVTLGKLYRCKKCRSGLITMQPAILVCPNCGATTPPTHIEASKLITCEECEKAPLMEVRLPGIEYPKPVSSFENDEIASKMSASVSEGLEESFEETQSEETQNVIESSSEVDLETEVHLKELDETSIFKADTNFIVKNQVNNTDDNEKESTVDTDKSDSLEQLNMFSDNIESESTIESDIKYDSEESQVDFDSEVYDDSHDMIPEIEVVSSSSNNDSEELPENNNLAEDSEVLVEPKIERAIAEPKKGVLGWSVPAWIPVVFALLLVGLYGMLYADLQSMRLQLERSQESIISQDQSFQQERKKYLSLIKSTQVENRNLRDEVMDLKSENNILRKKSISLEIPEIQD